MPSLGSPPGFCGYNNGKQFASALKGLNPVAKTDTLRIIIMPKTISFKNIIH